MAPSASAKGAIVDPQHDEVLGELRATYETLGAMVDRAIDRKTSVDFHVLSAARQLVHDALMEERARRG
jgi:hypothetical protein